VQNVDKTLDVYCLGADEASVEKIREHCKM
jgi:hypothetical protein